MKIQAIRNEILKKLMLLRSGVVAVISLETILPIVSAYFIGRLLDSISQSWDVVLRLGLIAAGCILLNFVLNWCQNYLWFRMIYEGIAMARSRVFEYIMQNPFSFFVNSKSGDVVNRMLNDAAQYAETALIAMPMLLVNVLNIGVVLGFVAWINYKIAILLAAMCAAYFLSYRYINVKLREYSTKERERYSNLMDCATNYYAGIPTIKLFGREREFAGRYREHVQNLCRQAVSLQRWKSLSLCISSMVIELMPVCVIVLGVYYVMRGSCTVGGLFSIYSCISTLGEPIRNLTDYNIMAQSAHVNEQRLEELLCEESRPGAVDIPEIESVKIEGMGFAYGADAKIIHDFNIEAKRGDVIGIVGASGGGKSTFLRILTGMLRPTEGSILVNGIPMDSVAYCSYLGRVAVMPQDIFVYDDDIMRNVVFERELPNGRLEKLLDILNMKDYMGRSMNELSGGEKRRVGLARTMAGEFDVLILDEPTSDIDMDMEGKIISYISDYAAKNNIIVFVVTHREAILSICNKVVTMAGAAAK